MEAGKGLERDEISFREPGFSEIFILDALSLILCEREQMEILGVAWGRLYLALLYVIVRLDVLV